MNRADLQRLAKERLRDTKALLAARRWSGAYYLAGYAVECALKARIAKKMKAEEFPDKPLADRCWTHDVERLMAVAGLEPDLEAAMAADPFLAENWATVTDWN